MTNRWNRIVYKLWSPIYDLVPDRLLFAAGRRRVFELLQLGANERVLLAGVGTGADLPFLFDRVRAVGLDLSPEMLAQATHKISNIKNVSLVQADALALPVSSEAFDVIVLTLLLSVVPDPRVCWQETLRVLRPGGRAIIFESSFRITKPPHSFADW